MEDEEKTLKDYIALDWLEAIHRVQLIKFYPELEFEEEEDDTDN